MGLKPELNPGVKPEAKSVLKLDANLDCKPGLKPDLDNKYNLIKIQKKYNKIVDIA